MNMENTGRLTLPTDVDMVDETIRLKNLLGADALRDCDATTMPEELLHQDAKYTQPITPRARTATGRCSTRRRSTIETAVNGRLIQKVPYGSGHINDTFLLCYETPDHSEKRYILQRMNHDIFRNRVAGDVERTENERRSRLFSGQRQKLLESRSVYRALNLSRKSGKRKRFL